MYEMLAEQLSNAWPTQMKNKKYLICTVFISQGDTCGDHCYVG